MRYLKIILAAGALTIGPSALSPCAPGVALAQGFACCRVCKAGKACGDSCIAQDKVCHKGKGCACDG